MELPARQKRDAPHHFARWKVERAIWISAQRLFRCPQNFFGKSGTKPTFDSLSYVPLPRFLLQDEALRDIGINKIDSMLRAPNCPFVLFVGTKKLVKRKEFEDYISQKLVI